MRVFLFLCLIKFALARPQDDDVFKHQNNGELGNQYAADTLENRQQYTLEEQQRLKQLQQLAPQQQLQQFPQQFQYNSEILQQQLQEIQLQKQQQQLLQQQLQQFPQQLQLQYFPDIQQLQQQEQPQQQLDQEKQQQQLQYHPEIQQSKQQEQQQLMQDQAEQHILQFYPEIQQLQVNELKFNNSRQEQKQLEQQQFYSELQQLKPPNIQQELEEQQQKQLTIARAPDSLQVFEYANRLAYQAQQLVQYEQQERQEQQQQLQKQQNQAIAENTSSLDQGNEIFMPSEQIQKQVFPRQLENLPQPHYNDQEQSLQLEPQQFQLDSIAQTLIEQRLKTPQVPQDLFKPQTTLISPQQYLTTTTQQYNDQKQQIQLEPQQIQFIEQHQGTPQVPQDLFKPQTTLISPQQYLTTTTQQYNDQKQQIQLEPQQIQFIEQHQGTPQVPQDLSIPQTTVTSPQQYSTTTVPTQDHKAQTVIYNKEFFYLAAPEDENNDEAENLESGITPLRKHFNVVFIKAPDSIEKAALRVAQQSVESQTAIYVLTKQHDIGALAKKLEQVRGTTHHAKPEVIFVKYKTPEEAEQAQRTIQAQYEALDGVNNYNTETEFANQNIVS